MRRLFALISVAAGIAVGFSGVGMEFLRRAATPYADYALYSDLASLPVNRAGRIMPISSAAADALRMAGGKSTYKDSSGQRQSASKWIWLLNAKPAEFQKLPLFRTDNPEISKLMGASGRYYTQEALEKNHAALIEGLKSDDERYARACESALAGSLEYSFASAALGFSFAQSTPRKTADDWFKAIDTAAAELISARAEKREPSDAKLAEASSTLKILNEVKLYEDAYPNSLIRIVPEADGHWLTSASALLKRDITPAEKEILLLFADIVSDISSDNAASARENAGILRAKMEASIGRKAVLKAEFENFFNNFDPFTRGFILYAAAFLLALGGLAARGEASKTLSICAGIFFAFALASQTFGIFARMYIQSRPPVTNLYSSVVFTGWGAAVLGFLTMRKGGALFMMAGAAAGGASLLLALNMPYSGDSMGMMTAVLNSNFWLTAHVVTIMLGYCGVFLAGFLASMKILSFALFRRPLNRENSENFFKNIYALLCFSLLFSFAGTMLGGVWADFSWGRFWGWDPKENGALMIILWVGAAIHAKTLHIVSDRTFLAMCAFGNVVAAWAWFGVNMLGVGLHSYGFMSGGWKWFAVFVILQTLIAIAALIPPKKNMEK